MKTIFKNEYFQLAVFLLVSYVTITGGFYFGLR